MRYRKSYYAYVVMSILSVTLVFGAWTTNGPEGTGISAIAIDQHNSRIVYVAYGGTVYKSIDNGESFTASTEGIMEIENIRALAVHPVFSNIVFAGGRHLYRSLNGGMTWQEIGNGLPPQNNNAMPGITDILIDETNPNIMYVSTYVVDNGVYGGVYKSMDSGENFSVITPANEQVFRVSSLTMDPVNHDIVYAGLWGCSLSGGVWKTTNGGDTWIQNTPMNPEHTIYAVQADPTASGRLFAGGLWSGCWRSDNYGETWDLVVPACYYCYAPGYADIGIHGSTVFYVCEGAGLFRSTNSGVSWVALENGIPPDGIYEVCVSEISSDLVFVGGAIRHNLYKSIDNGTRFSRNSDGFPQVNVFCVASATAPTTAVYSGALYDMGAFKSGNNGTTWFQTMAPTFRVREIAVHPNNPDIVLIVIEDIFCGNPYTRFFLHRSVDGGEHFTCVLGGLPGVGEIVFDQSNPDLVYIVVSSEYPPRFYVSENAGASWTAVFDQGLGMRYIKCLIIDESGVLYAGTHDAGVYRSTDAGYNWVPANTGIEEQDVVSLTKYFFYPGGIVAGADNEVYLTTDSGEHWEQIGDLPAVVNDVYGSQSITILDKQIGLIQPILWAATNQGVFEYINNDWEPRNQGLDTLYIRELAMTIPSSTMAEDMRNIDDQGQYPVQEPLYSILHAATPLGCYEYVLVDPSITESDGSQGDVHNVENTVDIHITPNPVHKNTTITFHLFQPDHVIMKVYNITGQIVQKLVDDYRLAGYYEVAWDGKDMSGVVLPSGIYFVKMETSNITTRHKLLVLR